MTWYTFLHCCYASMESNVWTCCWFEDSHIYSTELQHSESTSNIVVCLPVLLEIFFLPSTLQGLFWYPTTLVSSDFLLFALRSCFDVAPLPQAVRSYSVAPPYSSWLGFLPSQLFSIEQGRQFNFEISSDSSCLPLTNWLIVLLLIPWNTHVRYQIK